MDINKQFLKFVIIVILLPLAACKNPFMERILGKNNNEESPYTGHPGMGTETDPWIVHNVDTLRRVGTDPEPLAPEDPPSWHLGAHYRQVRNITLPAPEPGGSNWTPIGSSVAPFTGTYNGNGRTISGLIINSPDSDLGMFGYIAGPLVPERVAVRNLGLVNVSINGNGTGPPSFRVGGIAGNNGGTIQNCNVSGSVSGTGSEVGGLVGNNQIGGIVQSSFSTAAVSSTEGHNVGGLVGDNLGSVRNSYATGVVTGWGANYRIGGLVGRNNANIENCYATGTVRAFPGGPPENFADNNIGGLVGENQGTGTVQNSYATGSVSGTENVGGIAGINISTIQNCYATGTVTGFTNVGGVVGNSSGVLQNCVALNYDISGNQFNTKRIAGILSGTPSNNYGRVTMRYNNDPSHTWDDIGGDRPNGHNISNAEFYSTWWESPPGGWNSASPWLWGNVWDNVRPDRLPTLLNMPQGIQTPRVN